MRHVMSERNQQFDDRQQWRDGWKWLSRRGSQVHAICFDALGRPVTSCNDVTRAHTEKAFPIRWLWPNQVARLAMGCDLNAIIAADNPALDG